MTARLMLLAFGCLLAVESGRTEVLQIVREPRAVSSVSSKTEKAWTPCTQCSSRISYERTYRWDPYGRKWIETTSSVPTLCRKCQAAAKSRERLAHEEAVLDRKLEYKAAKQRVAEKRALLRNQ